MEDNKRGFDPNSIGVDNGRYFGLPFSNKEANVLLLSVPWDATVSYRDGTSNAPDNIISASLQCDLYDDTLPNAWKEAKIGTIEIDQDILEKNNAIREEATKVIDLLSSGTNPKDASLLKRTSKVNDASKELNLYVYNESLSWLKQGKIVGLVGGDHSTPFGLIKALAEIHLEFGVLHIDAHFDLREAYEGFKYSHASIMFNVLKEIDSVKKLVSIGVRDYCEEEYKLVLADPRIDCFLNKDIKRELFSGKNWKEQCQAIVLKLPKKVYISYDIDGLSPLYCPNTGTPVPGGLDYDQVLYLIDVIVKTGRSIIGFDLCEVGGNNEWDANVGARILYSLSNSTYLSNKL